MDILIWAQDHDETLPATGNVWVDCKIDPGLLHCPQVRKKGGNNYGYNNLLGGLALGDIGAPDQTRAHR